MTDEHTYFEAVTYPEAKASDLVERLRSTVYLDGSFGIEHTAADEIERLRNELKAERTLDRITCEMDEACCQCRQLRDEIERLQARCAELEKAVAAEREACLGECERIAAAAWDKWEQEADGHSRSNAVGAFACIEVIRARGEKP